jgi:hypothetical protein
MGMEKMMQSHKMALGSLTERLGGADYMKLASDPDAQEIAHKSLEMETARLRAHYGVGGG